GAVAELGVGFVHDDGDGAHGLEEIQNALEVAFGDTLPHAAEVLQGDGGNADLAGEAGGEERLPGANGTADDIAHGHDFGLAGANGAGGVVEFLLGGLVAGNHGEVEACLDEFEEAAG